MSYWKCTDIKILDDGLSIEATFKDAHSCSRRTIQMPAEDWKNIDVYKSAYDEPERRHAELAHLIARRAIAEIQETIKKAKEQP